MTRTSLGRTLAAQSGVVVGAVIGTLVTLLVVLPLVLTGHIQAAHLAQTNPAPTAPTLPYQGYLTAPDGTPINATLPMTFKLYAAPTEGEVLWTEARTSANAVPVTDGLFSVLLGQTEPLSVTMLEQPLWLGVTVDGDAEMTPRERINGGYAAVAGSVLGAVHSEQLDLTYDRACLDNDVVLDMAGGWRRVPVSGLQLDFSLDKPSLVLVSLEGNAVVGDADTANQWSLHLTVNGDRETNATGYPGSAGFEADNQRLLPLAAGDHSVSVMASSSPAGTMTIRGTSWRNHARTCINYVVLGEQ